MATASQLTPRQAKFIQEYLVDGNGAQAAIRAGTRPAGAHVWASRALRVPKVAAALKERQKADSERLGVSRDQVIGKLLEAYDLAKEQREPAAMVTAARELARLMGFYAPAAVAVEVTATAEVGRFDHMTDAELLKLMSAAPAAS